MQHTQTKTELPIAETGPNTVFSMTDHAASFVQLTPFEGRVLALRSEIDARISPSDYAKGEHFCDGCATLNSLIRGLCNACYIDQYMLDEWPGEFADLVVEKYDLVEKDEIHERADDFVIYSRDLDRRYRRELAATTNALKEVAV